MSSALRFVSLLIALIISASAVAACGDEGGNSPASTTAEQAADPISDGSEETEPETTQIPDDLPETDFGGRTFNLAVRSSRIYDFFTEEQTGEAQNDALYERNRMIEERFNMKFGFTQFDDGNMASNINKSLKAADGAFDIVVPDYWWGCETLNLYYDLLTVPNLDFDKPWWWDGWNQNVRIMNHLFTAVGYGTLDMIRNQEVVFFNKQMAVDFGLGDYYELVDNQGWTFERLFRDIETVTSDVNGDGQLVPQDDVFGASFGLHSGRNLFYSAGVRLASADENGYWSYDYMSERFEKIFGDISKLINATDGVEYNKMSGAEIHSAISEKRLLFWFANISNAVAMRSLEQDFGIIPTPKYDDLQEDYVTSNLGTSYFAIPLYVEHPEESAIILEALNAESWKLLKPTYYDVVLKAKGVRDEQSERMLDLILDKSYIDFVFVNTASLGGAAEAVFDAVVSKKESYAASYEKRLKSDTKKMDKLMSIYADAEG